VRRLLETVVRGVFRSRWFLALGLVVVIVAIVGVARLLAGPAPSRVLDTSTAVPTVSVDPHGDDSVVSPGPPPPPRVSRGTATPEAVAYAFASAWADHRNVSAKEWHDRLLPHSTRTLADKLAKTDPEVIPAGRVTGNPTLVPISAKLVEVRVPADSGELRLRLVAPEGRWLVDGVDWQRA
jgi:hypothetical protein